jgi:hypothetical protein
VSSPLGAEGLGRSPRWSNPTGAKAQNISNRYAALKGRSSTVVRSSEVIPHLAQDVIAVFLTRSVIRSGVLCPRGKQGKCQGVHRSFASLRMTNSSHALTIINVDTLLHGGEQ